MQQIWDRRHVISRLPRIVVVLLVVIGLVALLRLSGVLDRHFIYFPSAELLSTPADRGLEYEDVTLTTADGVKLHGWFVPGRSADTIVWFHGNGGNISHRVDSIAEIHHHIGPSIFIFDYRGYGKSEGSPSEEGTYVDAEAAIDYVVSRPDVDPGRLVYLGRSLGAAVAAEMALRRPPSRLILESGFTSIRAMARHAYPFLPGIELLISTRYDTLDKIGRVHVPVLITHGDSDQTVPFDMARELHEAANEPKRMYVVPGGTHNDSHVIGGDEYYEAIADFLGSR